MDVGNDVLSKAYYKIGDTGPLTQLQNVFAVRWTVKRGFEYIASFVPRPFYGSINGQLLTLDPDIAITLVDLVIPGEFPPQVADVPQLVIEYSRPGLPAINKKTTFRGVVFGSGTGAQIETVDAAVYKGAGSLITIPFLCLIPFDGRMSDFIVTINA